MNESEIKLKIQELEEKLNSKTKVLVNNKVKLKKIPIHLKNFYLEEISKLKLKIGENNDFKAIEINQTSTKKVKIEKYKGNKTSVRLIYTPMGNKR